MAVVITGAYGQLGGELCRQLGGDAAGVDIDTLDLTDGAAVMAAMLALRPEAVINCAAYTAVDKAETEPAKCLAVNVTAVEHLAQACARLDCPLVHISTDYLFGGRSGTPVPDERTTTCRSGTSVPDRVEAIPSPQSVASTLRPWREDDLPSPQGVYARTKLEGEQAAARYPKHLIVRTCGLYARPSDLRAANFVKTMLRLGAARPELHVVNDQHCTPTYATHLARAILFLLGRGRSPAPWGFYHITNTGETTWYEFAVEIFRRANMPVAVRAISTAEYGAVAPRPAYSVLDTSKYHQLGGPPMPDWDAALDEYFAERCNKD
jgi:dTDP-4-dehydrorhamnose reductase